MNTTGTFGVSSASCCWSRVSTAVGRLTQYLISRYANSSSQSHPRPCFGGSAGTDSVCDQRTGAPCLCYVRTTRLSQASSSLRRILPEVFAGAVERERHSQCAAVLLQEEQAPRVDAQVSDEGAGAGAWFPSVAPCGRPDDGHLYRVFR